MSQNIKLTKSEHLTIKPYIGGIIRSCERGKEITASQLSQMACLEFETKTFVPAKVRAAINTLRQEGNPICANHFGYYWATTPEQIAETIASLDSRIGSITSAKDGLVSALKDMIDDTPP